MNLTRLCSHFLPRFTPNGTCDQLHPVSPPSGSSPTRFLLRPSLFTFRTLAAPRQFADTLCHRHRLIQPYLNFRSLPERLPQRHSCPPATLPPQRWGHGVPRPSRPAPHAPGRAARRPSQMENAEHGTSLHGWTQRMGLRTRTARQPRQRYGWRRPCPARAQRGVRPARGDARQPAAGTLRQGVKWWETNARSRTRACSSSSHRCGTGGGWRGDKYGEGWVGADTNGDVLRQTKTQR